MPLEVPDAKTVVLDEVPAAPPPKAAPPATLNTTVKLTVGMLSFHDAHNDRQSCLFQFNPSDLERSRAIKFTRSPTGNTREEPGVGPRNQAKRKFTRKPEPWVMNLSLRYDASYHQDPESAHGSFKHRVHRIDEALNFFESLAEPGPFVSENEKEGNAEETPPPPLVDFTYGQRQWRCAVTNLRIKELEYTPDLYPRRFEVTLALEAIETVRNGVDGKPGAKR